MLCSEPIQRRRPSAGPLCGFFCDGSGHWAYLFVETQDMCIVESRDIRLVETQDMCCVEILDMCFVQSQYLASILTLILHDSSVELSCDAFATFSCTSQLKHLLLRALLEDFLPEMLSKAGVLAQRSMNKSQKTSHDSSTELSCNIEDRKSVV